MVLREQGGRTRESICRGQFNKTQFEIERRSCGQSMIYLRFFSCKGQNNFTGVYFFVCAFLKTYKKNAKKCPK